MTLKDNPPLVTVGVALYNHEKYIVQCLESIVKQTYSNIELIVIDDGSVDNSYQVAKAYLESQEYNKNYKITSRANQGICNTLNEIAKQSQGKYISIIGSDDYWFANKIQDQVKFLEENPQYALVHSNSIRVDEQGVEIGEINYKDVENTGYLFEAILKRNTFLNTPSHLYRTSVYDNIGYYDPTLKVEDIDFWLRLTKVFEVGFINKFHSYYRWQGENLSNKKNGGFYHDETIRIYKKNIDDLELRKYALAKIYRKVFLKAFQRGKPIRFLKHLFLYFRNKYF